MNLKSRPSRRKGSYDEQWKLPPIQVGDLKPRAILAPIDFTECSKKAITYAVALAKHFKARIILLNITTAAIVAPSPEFAMLDTDVLNAQASESAARLLSQWRDQVAEHVRVKMEVRIGADSADEIVDAARENDCDLIVMATHAKGMLEHLLSGSVAEKVVHHAPCPVFIVREHENDFIKPKPLRRRSLVRSGSEIKTKLP